LLKSSAEFVAGFTPPDYLIDGLIQRRFIYSFTGLTGSGKTGIVMRIAAHVALGLPLAAGREGEQGLVLFFAGEKPDDVRTRWIKLCEELKRDPAAMNVNFLDGAMPIGDFAVDKNVIRLGKRIRAQIDEEVEKLGPVSLVVIDTNAAYFQGDDEND